MSGHSLRKYRRSGRNAHYFVIEGITKKGKKIEGLRTYSGNHAAQLRQDLIRGRICEFGRVEVIGDDVRRGSRMINIP